MNDAILAFGSAAAGALLGSLSAFYLGVLQQRRDLRRKEHSALLRAQFALMSQWNVLEGIRKSLLERFRGDDSRYLKMPWFHAQGDAHYVPFEDLGFIALSDTPNLLHEVHIAEQKYRTALEGLRIWNQRILNFQNSEKNEVVDFDPETGAARVIATKQEVFFLKKAADILFEVVDQALPKLLGEIQVLEDYTKRHFKGMKVLRMVSK